MKRRFVVRVTIDDTTGTARELLHTVLAEAMTDVLPVVEPGTPITFTMEELT